MTHNGYGFKVLNHLNRQDAWKDWEAAVLAALNVPVAEIQAVAPKPEYGWKRIDKCTEKLQAIITKHEGKTS